MGVIILKLFNAWMGAENHCCGGVFKTLVSFIADGERCLPRLSPVPWGSVINLGREGLDMTSLESIYSSTNQ